MLSSLQYDSDIEISSVFVNKCLINLHDVWAVRRILLTYRWRLGSDILAVKGRLRVVLTLTPRSPRAALYQL